MVEVTDFPLCDGSSELLSQPRQLLWVHIVAIQCEEGRVTPAEIVIPLAVHVERLVETLIRAIMIAQTGIKLDSRVQQRSVWVLELSREIGLPLAAVKIVAHGEYKLEREHLVYEGDLWRHFVLLPPAGSEIADDRKAHRFRLERQRELRLGILCPKPAARDDDVEHC